MSVRLENVTISYRRRPAVHHVSGQFADGVPTAICGPNGAGKSTILKALVGLLRPDHGHIDLGGLHYEDIAYLPQAAEIDRGLPVSVLDLVLAGHWRRSGAFRGINRQAVDAALHALETVGLSGFESRAISQLSGGQFQRVLFARILVQDARLILLDEPFNSIDASTTADLLKLIHRWHHEGRTVIAVLHDHDQVRAAFTHTLLLSREVVAWGPTAEALSPENVRRANGNVAHWDAHPPVCHRDDAEASTETEAV